MTNVYEMMTDCIFRGFYWRVAAIGAMSLIPVYAAKVIQRTMKPPSYRKVQGI